MNFSSTSLLRSIHVNIGRNFGTTRRDESLPHTKERFRVPHPRRAFVFAARVGGRELLLRNLQNSSTVQSFFNVVGIKKQPQVLLFLVSKDDSLQVARLSMIHI